MLQVFGDESHDPKSERVFAVAAMFGTEEQWADLRKLRIPTKKIIHSELKTITASPGDAVGIIVEQVIVMGQEESGETVSIISFLRF